MTLLSLMQSEVEASKSAMLMNDLAAENGVLKGVSLQGHAKGVNRALDIILEIANYEEEP